MSKIYLQALNNKIPLKVETTLVILKLIDNKIEVVFPHNMCFCYYELDKNFNIDINFPCSL